VLATRRDEAEPTQAGEQTGRPVAQTDRPT
jgi:hypothetical protein